MLKLMRSIVSLLPADSVVGRFWSWRTSLPVTSCTFCVARGRVGSGCLRLTACSGSTDCGRAVWSHRKVAALHRPPLATSIMCYGVRHLRSARSHRLFGTDGCVSGRLPLHLGIQASAKQHHVSGNVEPG